LKTELLPTEERFLENYKLTGCVQELAEIEEVDLNNPKHLAKLVKESIHLMYQKQTSKRALYSLLENL
jgi:hypothetical protein